MRLALAFVLLPACTPVDCTTTCGLTATHIVGTCDDLQRAEDLARVVFAPIFTDGVACRGLAGVHVEAKPGTTSGSWIRETLICGYYSAPTRSIDIAEVPIHASCLGHEMAHAMDCWIGGRCDLSPGHDSWTSRGIYAAVNTWEPMLIPKSFAINGRRWKVYRAATADGDLGECHYDTRTITLDPLMGGEKLEETLLHELLHACCQETALLGDMEELVVEIISVRLLEALKTAGIWS